MTVGFEPNSSVLCCPLCDELVHTQRWSDLRPPDLVAVEIESAVQSHLAAVHPWRYRWYKRTGWAFWVRGLLGSLAS